MLSAGLEPRPACKTRFFEGGWRLDGRSPLKDHRSANFRGGGRTKERGHRREVAEIAIDDAKEHSNGGLVRRDRIEIAHKAEAKADVSEVAVEFSAFHCGNEIAAPCRGTAPRTFARRCPPPSALSTIPLMLTNSETIASGR